MNTEKKALPEALSTTTPVARHAKKLFSLLLAAIMVLSLMTPIVAAVTDPVFTVRVVCAPETVNGKQALTVDWMVAANTAGQRLRGSSGLRLAYDNTTLQLMRYSGTGADYTLTEQLSGMLSAAGPTVYEGAAYDVRACRSADSATGFVTIEIGHYEYTYDFVQGVEAALASIRFAFRDGKTEADLNSSSIRLMTIPELESKVQHAALNIVAISGDTNVEYAYRSRTVADSLNAPEILLPLQPYEKIEFAVESVTARAGKYVEVPVKLTNNTGISSIASLRVDFDGSRLEWDARNGEYDKEKPETWPFVAWGVFGYAAPDGANISSSHIILSFDTLATVTVDGTLLTLKFKVKDGAPAGDIPITLSVAKMYDGNEALINPATYELIDGVVTVSNILYGDVNGDGEIDSADVTRLRRYIAGWDVEIDLDAADVNDDGEVDSADVTRLRRFIAGWDVTLGPQ